MSIVIRYCECRSNFFILFLPNKTISFIPPCVQVYYILSRCSYFRDGCGDKDKKGIKRLLNNGTYTAAFPLHDVSLVWWTITSFSSIVKRYRDSDAFSKINNCEMNVTVSICASSLDTGPDRRTLTAKVTDTVSTNTGPDSSVSSRSSPSILYGKTLKQSTHIWCAFTQH